MKKSKPCSWLVTLLSFLPLTGFAPFSRQNRKITTKTIDNFTNLCYNAEIRFSYTVTSARVFNVILWHYNVP